MSDAIEIMTRSSPWRKLRGTNYATNGYPATAPTQTAPSLETDQAAGSTATSRNAIQLTTDNRGGQTLNSILIVPYGIGSSTNTFNMRVIGWSPLVSFGGSSVVDPGTNTSPNQIWVPLPLAEFICTLNSGQTGIAGAAILNTELFCDTIALVGTTGNQGVNCDVNSPANGTIGSVLVDIKGHPWIEVIFTTGGSATSCNGLFRLL